jgi:hypothetical protein
MLNYSQLKNESLIFEQSSLPAGRRAFIKFFQNRPPSLRFGEAGSQNFQDLGE